MESSGKSEDAAVALARFAAELTYDELPPEAVSAVKLIILDSLGTTLAANTLGDGCPEFVEVVRSMGGAPESTLLGFDEKLPAVNAALANGAMAHALNYDNGAGGAHLGPVTLPAALALAERAGQVSGREFIAAMAAGCEVVTRVAQATPRQPGQAHPQPTQIVGYFGAAAAAGRVIRLSADGMLSAFGLALMQASGNRQPVLEGTPSKAVYTAFPNHGGTLSALLAAQGLGGQCDVFEGEAGYFPTFYGSGHSREALAGELGEHFRLLAVTFKPWPTTGTVHGFIQAAIDLAEQHDLHPDGIASVHIRADEHIRTFAEPQESRRAPRTPVQAEDSAYFAVAKALANRTVTLADLQPEGLRQPEALELAKRIEVSFDAEGGDTEVEVVTTAGARYVAQIPSGQGGPRRPVRGEQVAHKFVDCAQHAARPAPRKSLDAIVKLIDHLEDVADMRELPALLKSDE